MEDWKKILIRQASVKGMCGENRTALHNVESKEEAVELYKKTIDWALEEQYPSINVLEQYFSDCEDMGLFVNKEFHGEVLDSELCYVFHNCKGTIYVDLNIEKAIIPMLYMANGCDMTVKRRDSISSMPIRVPIYSFGDNRIVAKDSDEIEFRKYNFDVK